MTLKIKDKTEYMTQNKKSNWEHTSLKSLFQLALDDIVPSYLASSLLGQFH